MTHTILSTLIVFSFTVTIDAAESPVGELPVGANGQPLNLDFETGTLRDWLVNGKAFEGQPIKGDTVHARRSDMRSQHQGKFWIGGYEKLKDVPKGTLTSAPFKVTHPWAAFLVGGGPHESTRVELVQSKDQKVIFKTTGPQSENMVRVLVDLRKHQNEEVHLRIVDQHSGGWGHVNFDDFRFYKARPKFPAAKKPKTVADIYEHQGLTAEKAAEVMTLPKGFHATVFASEPDLRQPIAMTIDDRGRIWVAEAYSYPVKVPKDKAKDRILIFEDTDGDGKHDKRTVFAEKLNLVSGLELGFGGVWVGAAPELLFIPDRNGDDKPDGPPEVVLDGWGYHDTHETLNSFIWGPDGWLYGCHGVFTHSRIGKPGTPNKDRTPINAGIWRYHPIKKKFEVFAWGTSNPWGVDFNEQGHCFLTCCVIPHLFHIIQGGRFRRQAGSHFQAHTYDDIKTIAKHRHWVGNQWNNADRARSDASGGGHAHAGAMFYLGGAWPEKYKGKLFMNNIHGARLNQDRVTRDGSGYVGDGMPDFCLTNDLWSQMLYLRYGPDGQVYVIDWYDRNQCHHRTIQNHDRSNGRLFKISYEKGPKHQAVNLQSETDAKLWEMQSNENEWYVRHARRILMERAASGKLDIAQRKKIIATYSKQSTRNRLRLLWALHVTGGVDEKLIGNALRDEDENIRSWVIQLASEDGKLSKANLKRFVEMAKSDKSKLVRLYLTSALQRIKDEKQSILQELLQHEEDANDHNLPLMYWYAMDDLMAKKPVQAWQLAANGKVPLLVEYTARRIASDNDPEQLAKVLATLGEASEADQIRILRGIQTGLAGVRQAAMPGNWKTVFDKLGSSNNETIRSGSWALAVKFGDPSVRDRMRNLLANAKTPVEQRRKHLETLLAARDQKLVPVLQNLLSDEQLRTDALRGLAAFDNPMIPKLILDLYPKLEGEAKRAALVTLITRAGYAQELLDAVGAKAIPATDLTADLIRQMQNLNDPAIRKKIGEVWGTVRRTAADKANLIRQYRRLARTTSEPETLRPLGRAVFAKTCAQCHTLFGTGGKVGPDLTGSNRANLEYLLSNVVDPSAVLGKDYVASVVRTKRGRVLTGLIRNETKTSIELITADQTMTVPRSEIESIMPSGKSMMPDDLLKPLSENEVRALVAYLGSPKQVPVQATKDNVKTFFNGKDLTGWKGDKKLWKVENGEIVGTSPGIKHNEFLKSHLIVKDFKFTVKVKLTPNDANSGIQFRSEALPDGEVKGYQADMGKGWWGKLYEERARGLLWKRPGDQHVKVGEWNTYEIVAVGSKIRTYLNGKLCVDLEDPPGKKQGIIALQIHSGGKMEVRFKDLKLELIEK